MHKSCQNLYYFWYFLIRESYVESNLTGFFFHFWIYRLLLVWCLIFLPIFCWFFVENWCLSGKPLLKKGLVIYWLALIFSQKQLGCRELYLLIGYTQTYHSDIRLCSFCYDNLEDISRKILLCYFVGLK